MAIISVVNKFAKSFVMNRIWGHLLASVSENEGIENTDFTHFLEFDILGFRKEMSVTLLLGTNST